MPAMLMAVSIWVLPCECVSIESPWMDGWMAIYSVELAYYLSYVVVWEQGMVHVMLVPWVTSQIVSGDK